MKKLLLILTLSLTVFLVGCKKDTTVVCTLNNAPTEFSWNEDDGYTEFIVNGEEMDDEFIDRLNEGIDFNNIEEQIQAFIGLLEEQGYSCE